IKAWVDQLGGLYETDRQAARKSLVAAGAAAEKRLVGGLSHADHRVRKGCLELLTMVDAPSGVERACAIFRSKEEDRSVQAAAFEYLKNHAAKAEDVFIDALDSPEESFRIGALDTLTSLKSAKALPKAAALFDKEAVKEIKARIFGLLKTGGEPARPYLLKLLGNTDATVRSDALLTLVAMNTPAEDLVEPVTKLLKLEATPDILDQAFDVLARAGAKAIPHLLEGLRSPSQGVRERALKAVKTERTEGALDGVAELFHREQVESLRATALEYLVDQGLRAEPALIKALESPLAAVRIEAIPALGKIKSEKVYDRVSALYGTEKDVKVRAACFAYLETVGLRAEGDLVVALKDEDPTIRRRAIRALGLAGSEKAIAPLAGLLNGEKAEFRAEVIEALAWIGEKAVTHLREGVKSQKTRETDASEVVALVDQLAVERIFDQMISEEGSTGTFPGQFETLAKFPRDRAMPVLWRMATESDFMIRSRDSMKLPSRYSMYLQCLALLAIGELGDAEALKKLQGLSFPEGEDRHREQLVALHRLGDKSSLEKFVASELKEGRKLTGDVDRNAAYRKLFNAALLQARVGLKDEALKVYQELTAAVEAAKQHLEFPDVAAAYYNTACLHAGAGRNADAVKALSRAVELGFRDFDWIFKDKDLDPIRGEEGYKKLTAEAEKSRRKVN
ncbi:MAG TPA: HEAT repeat domain-containing protein, partial [Planctomycetota bacterium]|nr:HEAT repeat domain-containing protein [Planctomycetota bacterium]